MLTGTMIRSSAAHRFSILRAPFSLRPMEPSSPLSFSSLSARRSLDVANGFEIRWRSLNDAQREAINREYALLEAQDWQTLSLEQKRASNMDWHAIILISSPTHHSMCIIFPSH